MNRRWSLAPIIVAHAVWPGCGQKPAGRADASDQSASCPLVGQYTLSSIACGQADITAAWKQSVGESTLFIAQSTGSGCAVDQTNSGSTCAETSRAVMTQISGESWRSTDEGIATCTPAACTFNSTDAPCAIGDRAGSYDLNVRLVDNTLTISPNRPTALCAASPVVMTLTRRQ